MTESGTRLIYKKELIRNQFKEQRGKRTNHLNGNKRNVETKETESKSHFDPSVHK